jgi:eukaryotic-like serine/threonine-protein kinase
MAKQEILHKIGDRYQILDILGEGGSGKTYRAIDLHSNTAVAIKILVLRGAPDWKTIELFEREAKILKQLDHPGIPRYLDFFREQVAGEDAFCLVQEIAPGNTLTSWIETSPTFSEREVKRIARQVLEILTHLQSFSPPIIHRDIKPQNIICTEEGKVYLVDFGAVRDTYHLTITGGSTIVGTYGYMAPEQFRGQAVLATDLYGLGTTILYLLTAQDPADLPVKQMKIDFRSSATPGKPPLLELSNPFADWLDVMLQPMPEDRFSNAAVALEHLDNNAKLTAKVPRPKYPIAQITQQEGNLKIVIPPIWLATRSSKKNFMVLVIGIAFVALSFWLLIAANLPTMAILLLLPAVMVSTPWLCVLSWRYFRAVSMLQEISFNDQEVALLNTRLGIRQSLQIHHINQMRGASCQHVTSVNLSNGIYLGVQGLFGAKKDLYLGTYLEYPEQRWLAQEINNHLQRLQPHNEESILETGSRSYPTY